MAGPRGKRPVFHKALGDRLLTLRERRGWSVQRAVNVAKGKQHSALTPNRLRWLEEGKTKHPDREVLLAVAEIYGENYQELAAAFVSANYGRDLIRHGGTTASGLLKGVADAVPPAAEARVRELEGRIKVYKAMFRRIRRLADQLRTTAVSGEEGSQTRGAQSGSRGSH